MAGLEDFTPIALIKIEGQLGHLNATLAAQLELEVLKNAKGEVDLSERLEGFYKQYIETRKEIDKYVAENLNQVMQTANEGSAEDTIAKMNQEMEESHDHRPEEV